MSRVLLVYPEFLIKDGPDFNIPLGLLHLGTYIESKGHEVKLLDCNISRNWEEKLRDCAKKNDVIGISAMTMHLPCVKKIVGILKSMPDFNGTTVMGEYIPPCFRSKHWRVESWIFLFAEKVNFP